MIYFDQMLHLFACHWHALQPVLVDANLLRITLAGRGQLVKMLITLEPHGIFGSKSACF